MKLLVATAIATTLFGECLGEWHARKDFSRQYADLIARDKAWAEAYQRVEDIAEHWGMELRGLSGNCAYDPLNHYLPAREISWTHVAVSPARPTE